MLEEGVGAVAFASGEAAIAAACLNLLKPGDELISSTSIYGGTHNLFASRFSALGINAKFVNIEDLEEVKMQLPIGQSLFLQKVSVIQD